MVSTCESAEPLLVGNAGLVLVMPFVPEMFTRLGLLEPGTGTAQRWSGPDGASRAVHLLQYLADGGGESPEDGLALNKVLCGLAVETRVRRGIALTHLERETCDALLAAVLAHWSAVGQSSVAALRETYLCREGKLDLTPGRLMLQVERKVADVLVDRVAWNFGLIECAWMVEPLRVVW